MEISSYFCGLLRMYELYIQGVPSICWQLRTKFWKSKNHICQKVRSVFKSLNKNLSDDILKLSKIKLEVFLNWISKKSVKSEKWFCTLPPQLIMPPTPLPPGKKNFFCTLPPQLIMPPAPLPPGNNSFISLYAFFARE